MERFKASFINEIEKMYKKRKVTVAAIASLIVIVLGQLIVSGIRTGWGIRGAGSTDFPILVLSVFVNTILPLFTTLVAIDVFAGEFSHNTMKVVLVRPASRLKIFSSKIAAVAFFVLTNLLLVMILSTLTGFLFNSASMSFAGFTRIVVSYLVTLIPIMAMALIIVFLANIFRSGVTVFFLSILLFFSFKVVGFVFPRYSSLLVTSMFDWYNLWIAQTLPFAKIFRQLIIMSGYAIMFFTAGYYMFDNKDL